MYAKKDQGGLTETQRQFVSEYILNGGNGNQAAIAAGYAAESAYQRAHELLKKPHVIAAIQVETIQYLATLGPGSLKTMKYLRDNAKSESVRYQAAEALANRAGVRVTAAPAKLERMSPEAILQKFNELKTQVDKIKANLERQESATEDNAPEPEKALH